MNTSDVEIWVDLDKYDLITPPTAAHMECARQAILQVMKSGAAPNELVVGLYRWTNTPGTLNYVCTGEEAS